MNDFLSHLPRIAFKKMKRRGRGLGSGKGAKSGRGITRHQKARESIPLHFEGGQGRMVKKYPLLRGKGRNKPIRRKPMIINLSDLDAFKEGEVVDIKALIDKKLVSEDAIKTGVKILSTGKLKKKLTIKIPVSQSVKNTVEKLGGRVEL